MGHRRPSRPIYLSRISPSFCSNHDSDPPVQLLRLLDHLLEILLTALWRRLLLALVGEVCCLHSHFPHRSLDSKSEVRVIEHLNCKVDRFRSKVHNQRIALELSFVIFVHLDSRFAAVNLFRNDATFCECMFDLVKVCI
jgi:hypothetical protein